MNVHQASITSPEDQSATFIELFFDLVFVFAITQVVSLFHDGVTWTAVGEAVVIFWLIWWAWTQFTWTLNAADTTHAFIEMGTLLATALAFSMAVSVPEVFHGHALWFAIPYVLVRTIGLTIYGKVAADAEMLGAVRQFAALSIGGMVAVLVGAFLGGEAQYALWGMAMFLDLIAAWVAGSSSSSAEAWQLHPEHFAERHGLIVIIALGETLIVLAAGLSGTEWDPALFWVGVLGVVASCGLWWSYFARARVVLEEALHQPKSGSRGELARDAFSFGHYAMVLGIIGFAVALEEGVHHAHDPLDLGARLTLGAGLVLFVAGMAAAIWRGTGRLLIVRLGLVFAAAGLIVAIPGPSVLTSLLLASGALVVLAVVEQRSPALAVNS